MTNEEAILCLKGMKNFGRDTFAEQTDWQESLDMAIKALEKEPVYFPTCVDCNTKMNEIREAYDKLKNQSGLRWIERFDNEDKWLECPHCHTDSTEAYNYCPNCGADMRESEGKE